MDQGAEARTPDMSSIDDGSVGTRDGDRSRKLDGVEKVTQVGGGGVCGSGINDPEIVGVFILIK